MSDSIQGEDHVKGAAGRLFERVGELTAVIAREEADSIARAGELVADAIARDGLVHLFGSGHSGLLAQEGFHRAGGLACVNPLLIPELSPAAGPEAATRAERDVRTADLVFFRYTLSPGDVLIVFSNSGVNAVPVVVAERARADGLAVIGVLSRAYMASARSSHPEGLKLGDVCDVVIDNHGEPGDAVLEVPGLPVRTAPTSTVTGALILHGVVAEAIARLIARGIDPPVYLSSKLPGADEHNARLNARYAGRIPLLTQPAPPSA